MLKKLSINLKRYLQKNSKKKIYTISFFLGVFIGFISYIVFIYILNNTVNVGHGIFLILKILSCILAVALGYTSKEKIGWIMSSIIYKSDSENTFKNK